MKNWVRILLGLLVVLIAARLALPAALKSFVNSELGMMKEYTGEVADVDVSLIAGEYVLKNVVLEKRNGEIPEPLLQVERMDLGIDWTALFYGELVADIATLRPVVAFVDGPTKSSSQVGAGPDWVERLNAIIPFRINAFTVEDGAFRFFRTVEGKGTAKLGDISQITVDAKNFSNVREENADVFATFELDGVVQDTAPITIAAELDPLTSPVEMNLDASLVELPLTSLNPLFKSSANIDAEAGTAEIYLEFASADGRFEGYVKPLIEDADILRIDEEGTFFGKVWEGIVEVAKNIFENSETDRVAAQVPLSGELGDIDPELIPAIFSILRNAFIEALSAGIGNTIEFSDVAIEGNGEEAGEE